MDPTILLSDHATIKERAHEILDQAAGSKGHVMNLGHGIDATTPEENAKCGPAATRCQPSRLPRRALTVDVRATSTNGGV